MAGRSALAEWLHSVRPAWMLDAACAEHDEIDWVPRNDRVSAAAASICMACLVLDECGDYALHNDVLGIWGGLSAGDRRVLAEQLGIKTQSLAPPPAPTGDLPCPNCGRLQATRRVCGTCRARSSRARRVAVAS